MSDEDLETPSTPTALYAYKGEEAKLGRPHFTGDVFQVGETFQILVQHPCALRRGHDLRADLLTANVRETNEKPRSKWRDHAVSQMPLPDLLDTVPYSIADFDCLRIVPSTDLRTDDRIAVLSQEGVNLLSQRWVYHSSRVVVPTHTFDRQTFGPYNEADLCEEWFTDHPDGVLSAMDFDAWVRSGDPSRQSQLGDPQSASSVRRAMRAHLRSLKVD